MTNVVLRMEDRKKITFEKNSIRELNTVRSLAILHSPSSILVALILWLSVFTTATAAEPPPLTRADVETLLSGRVSDIDILLEAKDRGVGFVLDGATLRRLKSLGAGSRLLIELSSRSVPLRADLAAADAQMKRGQYQAAAQSFTALIDKSPRLLVAIVGRGVARLRSGQPREAVVDFTRYLQFDEGNAGILLLRAEAHEAGSQPQDALEDYTRAIARSGATTSVLAKALLRRGDLLQSMGRYTEARDGYLESIERFPKNPTGYTRLAVLQAAVPVDALRHPKAALELADTAVELTVPQTPERAAAWDALAGAHAELGDFAAARERQSQAIALASPQDAAAYKKRLEFYRKEQPYRLPARAAASSAPTADKIAQVFLDDLVKIKGGVFQMGSEWYEDDERPVHRVTLSPFQIMAHEVTCGQWAMVKGKPPKAKANLPVHDVSWDDCLEFIASLNKRMARGGQVFRLPTEAEWEFAARCGKQTTYPFGESAEKLPDYAWFAKNSERTPHEVGKKKPNAYGLFDMHGNVAEWCVDSYAAYTEGAVKNPGREPGNGVLKVFRGGGFSNSARMCRSSARGLAPKKTRRSGLGFRLVADQTPALTQLADDVKEPPFTLDLAIQNASLRLVRDDSAAVRQSLIELHYIRGHMRLKQERPADALKDFARILQTSPNARLDYAIAARCHLAWIRATAGDKNIRDGATALAYADRANTLLYNTPWSWLALSTLSAAHAEQGDFPKAVERARQARDRAPRAFRAGVIARLKKIEAGETLRDEPPLLPLTELEFGAIK